VVSPGVVPLLYAVAMGAAALAALGFGRVYDRVGLRGLGVLPPLAATIPFLSFATSVPLVVLGAVVWGVAVGIHESTMRAAVADLVPRHRRGAGFGVFTAIYGLSWFGGAALIGLLYDHGIHVVAGYVVAVQVVAMVLVLPLLKKVATP
jgi:MFS family permease